MRVADVGEFDLIDILARTIAARSGQVASKGGETGFRLLHSIGDDAAAWWSGQGTRALTTDTMVEGVHFERRLTSWRDLGWKAMAVNMSDIAAMGCEPTLSVITLGLEPDLDVEWVVEMYEGMLDACETYGGTIVGGDVVRSPTLFITVAMLGDGAVLGRGGFQPLPYESEGRPGGFGPVEGPLLTRSAAAAGDLVAVTGSLGRSAAGLRLLMVGGRVDGQGQAALVRSHLHPTPRVVEGIALRQLGVRAAMDVSDGLLDDLRKMCANSGLGARIYADRIPVDDDVKQTFPDDWLALALNGGEDYELVFTAPIETIAKAQDALDTPITIIGEVVDGKGVEVIDPSGSTIDIGQGGWDHFLQSKIRG